MSERQPISEGKLEQSVLTLSKGSAILIVSLAVSYAFSFVRGIIVVRALPKDQYGLYSIGVSVMAILTVVCSLGLFESTQRFIALYRGKGNLKRAKGAAYSAVVVLSISAVIFMILMIVLAKPIQSLLDKPGVAWVIFVLAFMIPSVTVIGFVGSFFQGFEIAFPKAVFIDIFYSFLVMFLTILAAYLHPTLGAMILTWVAGAAVAAAVLLVYGVARIPIQMRRVEPQYDYRTLLAFALPLALALDLTIVMNQVDTLTLGYFKNSTQVGNYNAALSLTQLIPLFLIAIGFMYAPVAARLIGENREKSIQYFYKLTAKWLVVLTLPLWLLVFFYPTFVLRIVFGSRYQNASTVFQILTAGQFLVVCLGPAYLTLIAFGRAKLLLVNAAIGVIANTTLNLILVPRFGIKGAAISTATVTLMLGLIVLGEVYKKYRVHPFSLSYFKPVLCTAVATAILYYPMAYFLRRHLWVLPLYFVLLLGISIGSVFITGSYDDTEMDLLRSGRRRVINALTGIFN
jgi:O-antigen/teichoic acid export membrane protein